ncbi:hypothetical protein C7M84_018967 [Penaeus vannamei]|uniref:Uncharacterized protein n=1 Tax=Penaeus vannamei TaxID=6689 RepID=A0A423SG14_PENVA|nr:hypothetical protein C7M84_018967 [Penaeus vannamei]
MIVVFKFHSALVHTVTRLHLLPLIVPIPPIPPPRHDHTHLSMRPVLPPTYIPTSSTPILPLPYFLPLPYPSSPLPIPPIIPSSYLLHIPSLSLSPLHTPSQSLSLPFFIVSPFPIPLSPFLFLYMCISYLLISFHLLPHPLFFYLLFFLCCCHPPYIPTSPSPPPSSHPCFPLPTHPSTFLIPPIPPIPLLLLLLLLTTIHQYPRLHTPPIPQPPSALPLHPALNTPSIHPYCPPREGPPHPHSHNPSSDPLTVSHSSYPPRPIPPIPPPSTTPSLFTPPTHPHLPHHHASLFTLYPTPLPYASAALLSLLSLSNHVLLSLPLFIAVSISLSYFSSTTRVSLSSLLSSPRSSYCSSRLLISSLITDVTLPTMWILYSSSLSPLSFFSFIVLLLYHSISLFV